MKAVTVQFVYNGEIWPQENVQGILFGDKVLTSKDIAIYDAIKTDNPGVVTVNIDENDTDYLLENPMLLHELLTSDPGGGNPPTH